MERSPSLTSLLLLLYTFYVSELGLGHMCRHRKPSKQNVSVLIGAHTCLCDKFKLSLRSKSSRRTNRRTKCTKGRVEVRNAVERVEPLNCSLIQMPSSRYLNVSAYIVINE